MNNKLRNFGMNLQQKLTNSSRKHRPKQPVSSEKLALRTPPTRWRIPPSVVSVAAFAGGLSFLAGGAWMSIQMIMNPDAVMGLGHFLPERELINDKNNPPQTLAMIQQQLREEGLILGTPQPLPNPKNPNMEPDILLPVMVEGTPPKHLMCMSPCPQFSELRIYQPVPNDKSSEKLLRLVSQTQLEGPAESFVLASLPTDQRQASNRPQALTNIERLQGDAPVTGLWLNLTGYRKQGENTIAYGQVFHYNPSRVHLAMMMQWASPTGRVPSWQEVTASGQPELVVDHSVGLEPKFEVYQIQGNNFVPNPIELNEISLNASLLQEAGYRQVLALAKGGLWSSAQKLMENLKQQKINRGQSWPDSLQAQLDVITFHAKVTKGQANALWSEPTQKVLANLIDGRWEDALKIFQADLDNSYKISLLLKSDRGTIAKRLDTALKQDAKSSALMVWNALLRSAKEGRAKAVAWTREQRETGTISGDVGARVSQELERLEVAQAESLMVNHPGKFMGLAVPVAEINGQDWLLPKSNTPLELNPGQVWYQVRLAGFHDGQQWLRMPFDNLQLPNIEPGRRLWRLLGLNVDPTVQISMWLPNGTQQTTTAIVQAVSYRKGVLQLLAAGQTLPNVTKYPRPVAFSADTFRWLQPASVSLMELNSSQPVLVMMMLNNLWKDLQNSGRINAKQPKPSLDQMLQQSGTWQVQLVDLNGNQLPDAVLTLQSDVYSGLAGGNISTANNSGRPQTLIFDDSGQLIYSEFSANSGQFLTGFADLEDGGPVALVIDENSAYRFKRWSSERRRFE